MRLFKSSLLFICLLSTVFCAAQVPVVCDLTYITTIQSFNVYHHTPSGVTMYKAKMYIDADGSPRAYGPGDSGLDWTANAGHPGNWWGIVTDGGGNPILQTAADPYPGMYVSTTSLVNSAYGTNNPLRYVNSETVPFFVLPSPVVSAGGIHIGDVGYVYNTLTGQGCFAVYADAGPTTSLGEGSIYLAGQIGVDPDVRTGGTSSGVIDYIVFPNSGYGQGTIPTIAEIDSIGHYQLNLIGGPGIVACLGGPDHIAPTTQITAPTGWATTDFTASFTDADNVNGSGIEKSFYLVQENTGTEWRANHYRGFFSDDFDVTLHPDWTTLGGTWAINSAALEQTDESNANTNTYASLVQDSITSYLYHWKGKIGGSGTNRRAGLHFFCDDPTMSNRGNSYFVYFRVDGNVCQFYKVTNDVYSLVYSVPMAVNADQWYDYKVTYDPASGNIAVYQDDHFIGSWIDPAPYTTGNAISLRSGNCAYGVDDLRIYHAHSPTITISVGADSTHDVQYQNFNPVSPSCRVYSVTEDAAGNLSAIATQEVNIDWTVPSMGLLNDGTASDIDTTFSLTSLSAHWNPATDPHSGIASYSYAIGTAPGTTDVASWTSVNTDTAVTATGLSLIPGQYYFFNVSALNGAGLSDTTMSDGQWLYLNTAGIEQNVNEIYLAIYPNPFSEMATIIFNTGEPGEVSIALEDLLGNQVILQPTQYLAAGKHIFTLHPADLHLAAGMYTLICTGNGKSHQVKLMIQ